MTKLLAALAVAALCTALPTHVGAITEAEEQMKQCAAHGEDCGKCVSDKLCYMMTTGKCQSARIQVADAVRR